MKASFQEFFMKASLEKNLERLWRDSDLIAICDSAEPNVQVWTSKEIASEAV